MKKYLPFILMFIAFSFLNRNCFAQKATIGEVTNIAKRLSQQSYFFQNRLKSGQSVVIEKIDSVAVEGVTVGYFINYSPEGFAVIPAFKELTPKFANSGQGNLKINSDNVVYNFLKEELTLRYKALKDNNIPLEKISKNKDRWDKFLLKSATVEEIKQVPEAGSTTTGGLIETTWGQGSIYNDYCPEDPVTNSQSITGCVATAMAQVVNYWGEITGRPISVSLIEDYTSEIDPDDGLGTRTIQIDAESASFSNLSYPLNDDEIARLCYACGVSVEMNYSSSASGTQTSLTANSFVDNFGFADADVISFNSEFNNVLYQNIESGMPCLMAIANPANGGHAIICDGFRDDGTTVEFHLNYGWYGNIATGTPLFYEIPADLPSGYTTIRYGVANIVTGIGGIHDYAVNSINVSNTSPVVDETVSVCAIIKNVGIETEVMGQSFYLYVDDVQTKSSTSIDALAPGEEIERCFNWTATAGVHKLEIKVALNGDENPENDFDAITVLVGTEGALLIDGETNVTKNITVSRGSSMNLNLQLQNTGSQIISANISKSGEMAESIILVDGTTIALDIKETKVYEYRVSIPDNQPLDQKSATITFNYDNNQKTANVLLNINVVNFEEGSFSPTLESTSALIDGGPSFSRSISNTYNGNAYFHLDNDPATGYPQFLENTITLTSDEYARCNKASWNIYVKENESGAMDSKLYIKINETSTSEDFLTSIYNHSEDILEWITSGLNTAKIGITNLYIDRGDVDWTISQSTVIASVSKSAWAEDVTIPSEHYNAAKDGWDQCRLYFDVSTVYTSGDLHLYNNGELVDSEAIGSSDGGDTKSFYLTSGELELDNYLIIRGDAGDDTKVFLTNIRFELQYFTGDPNLSCTKTLSKTTVNTNENVTVNLLFENIGSNEADEPRYNDSPLPDGLVLVSGSLSGDPGDLEPTESSTRSYDIKGTIPGVYTFGNTSVTYDDPSGSNYTTEFNAVTLNVLGGNLLVAGELDATGVEINQNIIVSAAVTEDVTNTPVTDAIVECFITNTSTGTQFPSFYLAYNAGLEKYIGLPFETVEIGNYEVQINAQKQNYTEGNQSPALTFTVNPVPYLTVDPLTQIVDCNAGTVFFAVNSNIDWDIAENENWLDAIKLNNTTIQVDYIANQLEQVLNGLIYVTSMELSDRIASLSQEKCPIELPNTILTDYSITPILCYGDENASIQVSGSVTGENITDKGVIWSTIPDLIAGGSLISAGSGEGSFTLSIDGLPAGTYYFAVYGKNEAGINYSSPVELVTITESDQIILSQNSSATSTSISVQLSAIGGIPPYMYSLNNCDSQNNCQSFNWQESNTFLIGGLQSSTPYNVEAFVKDANGCEITDSWTVTTPPPNTPVIEISETTIYFGNQTINTTSSPQSSTVSGTNLTGDISITAPSGFEVSTDETTNYSSSLVIPQSGGTVNSTTIYVRFSPALEQPYSGNISHTSSGAVPKDVAVSGVGIEDIVCQPNWSLVTATNNTTAYCIVTIEEIPAEVGDKVGAFVGDECRGIGNIVIDNSEAFSTILIQGDSPETVTFKVWDVSECTELDACGTITSAPGSIIGSPDYIIVDVCTDVTQQVCLNSNWNLKSFYVDVSDKTLPILFGDLPCNIIQIKDMTRSWDPTAPAFLNTLTAITCGEGYFIKSQNICCFDLTGPVCQDVFIDLNINWNLVGYPQEVCQEVESAFADILVDNCLVQVKNMTESYDPTAPSFLNTLTHLMPGEGYFLNSSCVYNDYQIPESSGCTKSASISELCECGWEFTGYEKSMVAYGEITINKAPIKGDAFIGAFVGEECRAVVPLIYNEGKSYASMVINGIKKEEVKFKLCTNGKVYNSETKIISKPDGSIQSIIPIDFVISGLIEDRPLLTVNPNPFRNILEINVRLQEQDDISIKVYSSDSRLIMTFQKDYANAGIHTFRWDAKDYSGNVCSPGMYFIHFSGKTGNAIEKVIFNK